MFAYASTIFGKCFRTKYINVHDDLTSAECFEYAAVFVPTEARWFSAIGNRHMTLLFGNIDMTFWNIQ
jgi:hypothetical protein